MTQSKMATQILRKEQRGRHSSNCHSDIKKSNNKKKEIKITFQGLSGNTNPYNHPDCNHVEVLKTACEKYRIH